MKSKIISKTTTNRGEFNRAYKEYLSHAKNGISCSYCKYHRNENGAGRGYYGSYGKNGIKYPNWKLVSKLPKQWMKKPIKIVVEYRINHDRSYTTINW